MRSADFSKDMSEFQSKYNAKPTLRSLSPVKDRLTFLYVDRCTISRDRSAISIIDRRGQVNIPSSVLSVLMLGPGTDITHRAVQLIADSGCHSLDITYALT